MFDVYRVLEISTNFYIHVVDIGVTGSYTKEGESSKAEKNR